MCVCVSLFDPTFIIIIIILKGSRANKLAPRSPSLSLPSPTTFFLSHVAMNESNPLIDLAKADYNQLELSKSIFGSFHSKPAQTLFPKWVYTDKIYSKS